MLISSVLDTSNVKPEAVPNISLFSPTQGLPGGSLEIVRDAPGRLNIKKFITRLDKVTRQDDEKDSLRLKSDRTTWPSLGELSGGHNGESAHAGWFGGLWLSVIFFRKMGKHMRSPVA